MPSDGLTTCLWFDGQAEEAAGRYVSIFEEAELGSIARYTEAGPAPAGTVMTVDFTLRGQRFVALNGGPEFTFNEAISFQVFCDTQAEIDRYWNALLEGGKPEQCGWLRDRYGVCWQVVPSMLQEWMASPDRDKSRRVTEAMMKMQKFDIAKLQAAFEGR